MKRRRLRKRSVSAAVIDEDHFVRLLQMVQDAAQLAVQRLEMVDPEGLAERLDGEDPPLLLDVRDGDEFAAGRIPGALNIPYGQILERLAEVPRERTVAAVCSGGKRSGLAASILQREGYESVLHVASGGVGTWRRQGRAIETS